VSRDNCHMTNKSDNRSDT